MKKIFLILWILLVSWCAFETVTYQEDSIPTWNTTANLVEKTNEVQNNFDNIQKENKYSFWYEYNRFNSWTIEFSSQDRIFTKDEWILLEKYNWELDYETIEYLIPWIFWPDTYYYDGYIYLDWWYWTWRLPVDGKTFKKETKEDSEWYNFEILSDDFYYYQIIRYWNYEDKSEYYEVTRIKK